MTHIHFRRKQLQGSLAALHLYFMCLNCVASLHNSGNEFTLSVTSIVFTRFQGQPAWCWALQKLYLWALGSMH